MRTIGYAALAALSLFLPTAFAQQGEEGAGEAFGLDPGRHSVGFRLLEGEDPSRAVNGGSGSTPQPRPVRTYLWYPTGAAGEPMRFGRYAALADEDIWAPEIAGSLRDRLEFQRRPLARSLSPEGFEALLRRLVRAVGNAEPLHGPFPLIVIGMGLYYESPIALAAWGEFLAGRGFVVATTPLVGTNSPLVKLDVQDLESQVRDLELVIARARQLPFVSQDRLGVLGFDMGGMVGLILTMRHRDVDAFMSLDAGILFEHPSGLPRIAPDYDPFSLRVPWFHATADYGVVPPPDSQSPSFFETAAYSERYLWVAEGLAHVDFTSYALVDGRGFIDGYWPAATEEGVAGHRALSRYVESFFAAYLLEDAASRRFLAAAPEQPRGGPNITVDHRQAAPASKTYEEVVHAIATGRAGEAVGELRSLAATEPDHFLLQETYLDRLAVSLLFTWNLAAEAIPLLEFMAERYPASARAQLMLAESHIRAGDNRAAIGVYEQYLEQFPDAARIRARLESLRKAEAP